MILPEAAPDRGTRLGALLAQPVDRAELVAALEAYTVRGDASDTLKVIVNGEIGPGTSVEPPIQYALVITQGNAVVFQTNGTARQDADVARVVLAAQLAPGRYRARLAALDAAGRGGTVELPLSVGLRAVGSLQASDLLVGTAEDPFKPAVHVRTARNMAALLELYSADTSRFAATQVRFELLLPNETTAVAHGNGTLRQTDLERRQIAEGTIDATNLAPGEYIVSAIITDNGQAVGRVSRGIRVVP